MKREPRPFVVEVRRGAKKQSAPFLPEPPEPDDKGSQSRASEILFSREAPASTAAPARMGRILEPILEAKTEEVPPEAEQAVGRRRGRPPGSKNRQRGEQDDATPARRGRPRSGPEGRHLSLTPELVDQAMRSIEKLAPAGASADGDPQSEGDKSASAPSPHFSAPQFAPPTAQPSGRAQAPARQGRQRPSARTGGLEQGAFADLPRLFRLGERWRGRSLARSLARRQRRESSN